MGDAWIDGRPVALDTAIAAAARLLGASRFPVLAGLGTDVAGARAAILLVQRLRGVVDHMHSEALLRDLDVMREAGVMATTPNEARLRGDLLLLVGPGLIAPWPDLPARLLSRPTPSERGEAVERRVYWLCPGASQPDDYAHTIEIERLGRGPAELPVVLALLRARVAGQPVEKTSIPRKAVDRLAAELKAAKFGVAVWSAATLDALSLEMLCGLVNDLNDGTRFTGLPLATGDNAVGANQVCGWMTGFPVRTGFGRGYPEHDPWRFEAKRLVESGEADCALWVSAYGSAGPNWTRAVATVALTASEAAVDPAPRVQIAVGRPGEEHDAIEHSPLTGTLVAVSAARPGKRISVADAITRIAAALSEAGA